MKKRFLSGLLFGVAALALASCQTQQPEPQKTPTAVESSSEEELDLTGNYNLTLWCSETEGVKEQFQSQVEAFNTANAALGINVTATIEGVSEGKAAGNMASDIENGADIYCFAQDQLARLVKAGALGELSKTNAAFVKNSNDAGSVKAAMVGENVYAYPMTSDNGYFMYYDKSVISASDTTDLATLVAKCEAAGKMFCFDLGNAWYAASFFFGAGCKNEWATNDDGDFTSFVDTFNSANGLTAMKGMQILTKSTSYLAASDAPGSFAAATPAAVVVSGTWDYAKTKEALGDDFACTKLPSYTVDGKTYQLGSFSGYKLLGVKPQADAKKSAVCNLLAQYLTGAACQNQRFSTFGWGPSNKAAQGSEAVQAAPQLVALNAQSPYSVAQGNISDAWWDICAALGTASKNADKGDATALQAALTAYEKALNDSLTYTGFVLVGAWQPDTYGLDGWTNMDVTTPAYMTKNGTVYTATVEVKATTTYKGGRVTQVTKWQSDKGYSIVDAESKALCDVEACEAKTNDGNNIILKEAGTYRFTYDSAANTIHIEKLA